MADDGRDLAAGLEAIARFLDHESVSMGDDLREIAAEFRQLRARVAELEGAGWVPVEERLPPEDEVVLCREWPGRTLFGRLRGGPDWWEVGTHHEPDIDSYNVTHWMPI